MINMVMKVPQGTNMELLTEILLATVQCRQTGELDKRSYRERIGFDERKSESEYTMDADFATVEFMNLVEEMKIMLPIGETYFENLGDTATTYEERMEYYREGDIADNVLWRLWDEEPHNPREKMSA